MPKKPLLRGHFHQAAFFISLGACLMLVFQAQGVRDVASALIYSLSLTGLFGVSALYHRPQWKERMRMWMRRLDHTAIYVLIAGTGTPICLLALKNGAGLRLLALTWTAAAFGVIQSLFWVKAPKWASALLYVAVGSLVLPYLPELKEALSLPSLVLLASGGIIYILGAGVYATKRPNPWPEVFGYHEIFHLLVIAAAALHFLVIEGLIRSG